MLISQKPCEIQGIDHCSLATVIALDEERYVTRQSLQQEFEHWASTDDVFQTDFLRFVIFITPSAKRKGELIAEEAVAFLGSQGNKLIKMTTNHDGTIPTGFYLVATRNLYQVYRLHEDRLGAFMASTMRGKRELNSRRPFVTHD